jgi:triacylglycerol lipase
MRVGIITTALSRPATYVGGVREVTSLARLAVRFPFGLVDAADAGMRAVSPSGDVCHDTPVVLVHGFGHNRSGWERLERRLADRGFGCVSSVNYNPFRHDVPEIAAELGQHIERIRQVSGSGKVNVVGHSLGGVLLRWYVQELGGDRVVDTAITVASPHEGTRAAFIGGNRTAQELRPGSWVIHRLAAGARPTSVRWVALYSNLDVLVQPCSSAMLRDPVLGARNVLVKDRGHIAIMGSSKTASIILDELEHRDSFRRGLKGLADVQADDVVAFADGHERARQLDRPG